MNTTVYQEERRIEQICIWNPMTTWWIYYVNIDLCHQYGIFVTESQTFLLTNFGDLSRR